MATSKQMQERAKAKKKAEALFAKLQNPNTASWVDEGYSRLLAQQLYQKLQSAASDMSRSTHLNNIRRDFAYVCEEPIKAGIRVWFLDNSLSRPGHVILSPFDYGKDGKRLDSSLLNTNSKTIYISKHGLERTYERLRSNSLTDAKNIVKELLVLMGTPPKEGEEVELKVDGGTFFLIGDTMNQATAEGISDAIPDWQPVMIRKNHQTQMATVGDLRKVKSKPFWVVKTYIADKK